MIIQITIPHHSRPTHPRVRRLHSATATILPTTLTFSKPHHPSPAHPAFQRQPKLRSRPFMNPSPRLPEPSFIFFFKFIQFISLVNFLIDDFDSVGFDFFVSEESDLGIDMKRFSQKRLKALL